MLLALSTEVDFKTGESLFASQQVEMLEQEHKRKQGDFLRQQVLLQAFMDIKRRLPPKVYDEIIMRVSQNQDRETLRHAGASEQQLQKIASTDDKDKTEKVGSIHVVIAFI